VVAPSSSIGSPPVSTTPIAVSVDLPSASVQVAGELDRNSAHHLLEAVEMLATRPNRRWQLDTAGVTFCDAGGLRALSSAHTLAAANGRTLRLVRSSRSVDRLVDLLGSEEVFPAPGAATSARRPGPGPAWTALFRCGTTGPA